jgi:predicted amidohydrolase YtcJ
MGSTLLRNLRIWSGHVLEGADAALIVDGRFAYVGRESDISAPSCTDVIDAGGRLLVPGFTDGHAHLLGTGAAMRSVNLKNAISIEEAVRRVAERVAAIPGGWVRGAGWDQNDWPDARFPHRRDLDGVAPKHRVALNHTSGHCLWVNSAALRAANITAATPSPTGGAIDHDDDGEPTGILRDTASRLVTDVAPNPTQPERIATMRDAIGHAHSLGVTGVHAMDVGRGELQTMHALHDAGELHLRTHAFLTATRLDEWSGRNIATGDGDDMMRIGGVKFFADGALGSLTAWMFEPYAGTANVGFPLQPVERLEHEVRRCLTGGLATAIHAIGDRANREVLDIYERAATLSPHLPRRIEHAQVLSSADTARFSSLGVTASMQPIHATQDMAKVDRSWGERGRGAYAMASLLGIGANLAFGSDTPVETMDPIAGIHAAVTRRNAAGEPPAGWYPDEKISVEAALRAYTEGCAAAVGQATTSGRIAPGYHADAVLLSSDILAGDDRMRILDARADITIVGGDIVYEREPR